MALAAGAGTRLRPLTTLQPKALCPVDNIALLDRAVANVHSHVVGVAVNAHHLADRIVEHLDGQFHVSVEQPVALGTAGALGKLRDWIGGRDVLLCNADAYLPGGLDHLVAGWDRQRCRLLVVATSAPGDFTDAGGPVRYVGACLLPWRLVSALSPEPSGLHEVLWRTEAAAGRLDLVRHTATAIDCGTPADYLRANLHASNGRSVIGAGATVEGRIERCVVWSDAHVGSDEHLIDCVRAGTRDAPLTVPATATGRQPHTSGSHSDT
ncbi:MAG: NTP transferase domain-containing protein [Actinobacteria bacterium]|nr:NTP transferase domain-containing protein [Actinomycetota bacterium]